MKKFVLLAFLGILVSFICSCVTTDDASKKTTTNTISDDNDNIGSGDSKTDEDKRKEEMERQMRKEGTITFDPQKHKGTHDDQFGKNQCICVAEFSDKREQGLGNLVGMVYGLVYHQPVYNLFNTEPIGPAIQHVMASLLSANGFKVTCDKATLNNCLLMEGAGNKIWVGLHHSIHAEIEIDIEITDPKNSKIFWSGKILENKEMETEKGAAYGAFLGSMGDGNELAPYLNAVIGEAISKTWNEGNLKMSLQKYATIKKAENQLKEQPVATNNADENFKKGIGYSELGNFTEAVKYFQKAVNVKPEWARARYNLGTAYIKIHNKDAAIAQYEILKTLDQNYARKLFGIIYQ